MQKFYGGFNFKQVRTYDITLKYQALLTGAADVASAFSTDGAIATDNLVVLRDDRNFWPAYNVAPVVREDTLARDPRIATVLDGLSPAITDRAAARMNAAVEGGKQDPGDVADAFVARERVSASGPDEVNGAAIRLRATRACAIRMPDRDAIAHVDVRSEARRARRAARPFRVAESRRCCAP